MKKKITTIVDVLYLLIMIGFIVGCFLGNHHIYLILIFFLCLIVTIRPSFKNRPHKKELNVLLNDERHVKINTEAEAKTYRFLKKISCLLIGVSSLALLIAEKKLTDYQPLIYCFAYAIGSFMILGFIVEIYYSVKISKQV